MIEWKKGDEKYVKNNLSKKIERFYTKEIN